MRDRTQDHTFVHVRRVHKNETMAELRPALPPEHIYNGTSHQNIITSTPFLQKLLFKIQIASHTLNLSTESRYASFVLFHRCLSHYIHAQSYNCNDADTDTISVSHAGSETSINAKSSIEVTKSQREELGKFAAASIFLACKLCNQLRRIRDVINVKHVLQFDYPQPNKEQSQSQSSSQEQAPAGANEAASASASNDIDIDIDIDTPPIPPPDLDEDYWLSKEDMVQVEQKFLRIIKFDVNVAFPHRFLVVVFEELVKVITVTESTFSENDSDLKLESKPKLSNGDDKDSSANHGKMSPQNGNEFSVEVDIEQKIWSKLLKIGWRRLNDSLFHVDSLMCKASSLGCAALSLALQEELGAGSVTDAVNPNVTLEIMRKKRMFDRIEKEEWWNWVDVERVEMEVAKEKLLQAAQDSKVIFQEILSI